MKPTLEEVKEHFKDALTIKCIQEGDVGVFSTEYYTDYGSDIYAGEKDSRQCYRVWDDIKGYADIVETKPTIPERYKTNSIDVIDFCKLYDLNFNLGSIIKYACRKKDQDIEDLKKIIDFAQREIKHLETFK